MGRTKQGGSVLSFIIVGILLLGALAGGVYLYRHVWAPGAGHETASKPASPSETNAPAQNSGNGSSNSSDQSKSSDSSKSSSDTSKNGSNSTPAQPSQPKSTPAPQSQPSSQLPTTGPADTLATMLILGAVTAAAAAYAQSRRAVRSL